MKLFVWDFHGVLEKDNQNAVLEISNKALEEAGYEERFRIELVYDLYGLKWFEYFKRLLPEQDNLEHIRLQDMCVALQTEHPEMIARNIKPNDHVHDVLEAIAQKYDQIVISNTMPESFQMFLDAINVTKYFTDGRAIAVDSHRNAVSSKKEALRDYIAGKGFDELIFIDDNPANMELLSVAGGVFYLYTHPGLPFRECADKAYKINDLREVLKRI